MSLYLQLVFALLTFELALFIMLVIPMPFRMRKRMFVFLSNSPIVSRGIYGMKILFIFVTVLFIDSLQHMLRVHNEGVSAKEKGTRGDLRAETDWRSRKFLSERNFYLTGLVTGASPGDLFVHRNIANTFSQKDGSALAALAYAVNHLGVSHVVVCGHYGCGGVIAAMESAKNRQAVELEADEGAEAIQQWLSPIRALAVAEARVKERSATSDSDASDATDALKRLVEKNVCAQVSNVASCSVIKNAWKAGKSVTVHGWVYDIATGKIDDLNVGEGSEIA
ncbi:MAG: hypothetical protein CYPHOPRED_002853 [Cyphobasidiales sp. Tagirdzhanova-0007]|nr:MAG: hypothetical protein CYPHOPRED_002853 [Cyphobasidiales sp. Tagirdzhanova-0007]